MILQVFGSPWVDKNKCNALNMVYQYADFLGLPVQKAKFKVYDNKEMYVPNPEMVKQFIYRVRTPNGRARIKIAVETGASAGEVWHLD